MQSRRITISMPEAVARRVKKAAGRMPLSTWITERLEEVLDEAELAQRFEEFYRDVSPSPDEVRQADALFEQLTGRKRAR